MRVKGLVQGPSNGGFESASFGLQVHDCNLHQIYLVSFYKFSFKTSVMELLDVTCILRWAAGGSIPCSFHSKPRPKVVCVDLCHGEQWEKPLHISEEEEWTKDGVEQEEKIKLHLVVNSIREYGGSPDSSCPLRELGLVHIA